jgi:OOP family OmpA-OmpF porin
LLALNTDHGLLRIIQENSMSKKALVGLVAAFSLAALAACSSTPYTPVVSQADPIDTLAYAQKVDTFIVLLDASGSMNNDDAGRPRIYDALDWMASFNNAVPPMEFNSGIVTYGKGATGSCIGYGIASTLYGPTAYNSADFANALGSIECAASTTPIAEALVSTTGLLSEEEGQEFGRTAVIIVSDFNWNDPAAVEQALAQLRADHVDNLCVHTVKIGNDTIHDAMIAGLTDTAGCDSAVLASEFASGATLSTYVAETLLTPLEKALEYETHTVSAHALFDFDKSILKEQGKAELQKLDGMIKAQGMSVRDIDVVGHTDSVGTDAYNQALSERRAKAVRDYMVGEGINPGIVDVIGMGKRQPVATNDTDEGRALNRRVDILVGTKQPAR